jgi:hypothetical protein
MTSRRHRLDAITEEHGLVSTQLAIKVASDLRFPE